MPKYSCKGYVTTAPNQLNHICRTCEFKTFSETALRLHNKVVHKRVRKSEYYCYTCEKHFQTPQKLLAHNITHQKRRPVSKWR